MLVTDLSMPEMDGLTLIRNVHSRRPGLPTILLAGFAAKPLEIENNSVSCVLRKPISANDLADQIQRMLSGTI